MAKPDGSGGVLNYSTCAQQLLYEIADPSAYVTPDVVGYSFKYRVDVGYHLVQNFSFKFLPFTLGLRYS